VNISFFFIAVAAVIIWQTFKGWKIGHFQKNETHSCLSGSAISTHVGAMVLGRFIVGLGLGLSSPVTSMYVSEVLLQPTTLHGYVSLAKKHGNWMRASSSIQHECFFFFDLVFLHVFMQISPASVRGTYGSLLQIASCVGILAALVAGLPAHSVPGWYVVEILSCWRDVCATLPIYTTSYFFIVL